MFAGEVSIQIIVSNK